MNRLVLPLLQKDDDKKSGHYKLKALHIDLYDGAEQPADRSPYYPVAVIQQGYEEHIPPFVHPRRDISRVIDGKGFIAQTEDKI
ncbi:hypothetical protein D1872_299900 [compost metagenome]